MSIRAKGINHFALSVQDLDRSIEFYQRTFGLPELALGAADTTRHAFLDFGYLVLELLESENGRPQPPGHGSLGPFHLCFEVTDIKAECRRLEELGVQLNIEYGEFQNEALGRIGYVFFRDPDGHDLQLAETLEPRA